MRRIVVQEFVTLDGVMQSPGTPDEDTRGGFEHGGWTAPFFAEADAEASAFMRKHLSPSDLLLGRWTFELFADYWPRNADEWPGVLEVDKYVVSTTLSERDVAASGWANSRLLAGIDDVRRLRASGDAPLKVIGSALLTQSLLKHGLVDELVLMTFPVVLGDGKRLFAGEAAPAAFRLVEGVMTTSGAYFARFEKAGPVQTGPVGA